MYNPEFVNPKGDFHYTTLLFIASNGTRASNPMLLLPVGYPADDARVPDLERKRLEEVSEFWD